MLYSQMKDQQRRMAAAGFNFSRLEKCNKSDINSYWTMVISASAEMAAVDIDCKFVERFRRTVLTPEDPLVSVLMESDC